MPTAQTLVSFCQCVRAPLPSPRPLPSGHLLRAVAPTYLSAEAHPIFQAPYSPRAHRGGREDCGRGSEKAGAHF